MQEQNRDSVRIVGRTLPHEMERDWLLLLRVIDRRYGNGVVREVAVHISLCSWTSRSALPNVPLRLSWSPEADGEIDHELYSSLAFISPRLCEELAIIAGVQ